MSNDNVKTSPEKSTAEHGASVLRCAHMMVNLMRSHQRWLWIVISVLVGISFISFYSNRTQTDAVGTDRVGKIYGHTLTASEIQKTERQVRVAAELGLMHLTQREIFGGGDLVDAAVNNLIIQHEADRMNIYPTDDEVADAELKLAVFAGPDGQFDLAKQKEVMNERLVPYGFSANQLDDLVRQDLQVAKLRQIVDTTAVITPLEVRRYYERLYAKTEASVIRFQKADVLATLPEPTDEDIKKYYADQKDRFIQPEKRKVQYVRFGFDDAQKKLTGKERMDALTPLGNQAVQFLEKLLDQKGKEDFAATAAADKLVVKETADFDEETPGAEEAAIQGFAPAAFKLRKDNPDSDVPLQTADAFYDLHLSAVVPARPLTLDEARPQVIAAIKDERATAALAAKAEEARTKIEASLKAGKTLPEAAKEAGQTVQELAPFAEAEPAQGVPDAASVASTAQALDKGELSKFEPTGTGGILVYVRNRQGIDDALFEKQKPMLTRNLQRQKEAFYFYEWLQSSREAANVQIDGRLRG